MTMEEAKIGDKVSFRPGPRSKENVTAEVIAKHPGHRGGFLETRDAQQMTRKIRPGSCTLVS